MFANSGFFRDISCPYFIHGLCVRPYCHFKHSKTEEAKVRKKEEEAQKAASKENDDAYTPVPTSSLQQTLASIEESIKSEKQKLLQKDKDSSKEVSVKTSATKTQPTGTPKYNPTPLHALGKQKNNGKHGNSKYDLTLIGDTTSSSEYDPASNYSTPAFGSTQSEDVSKASELENKDENNSELQDAKIPEFVSIDYTPTTFGELSDEESVGDKQENSENESEKSTENINETLAGDAENSKSKDSIKKESLPIEFSSDGSVKIVPYSADTVKSKPNTSVKSKTNNTLKSKTNNTVEESESKSVKKAKKGINIFSLFEEEFDKELETCASTDAGKSNKSEKRRSSKDSDKKEKSTQECLKKSTATSKHRDSTHAENGTDKSKHSSKHSTHSHHSDKHTPHKHDKSKCSSSSSKHHSLSKHSDSPSNHSSKPVKSDKHDHKSEKHRPGSSSKHSESSRHSESSSSKHTSKSSRNGLFLEKSDKSSKHSEKTHHNKERGKHRSDERKSKHHHSPEKTGKRKSSTDTEKSVSPKKKKITSLDVDLFGGGESDSDVIDFRKGKDDKRHLDLDLDSDLEKYFSDEDPFDECLRIFNEQPVPSTSSGSASKKKVKKKDDGDVAATASGKKRVALKQGDEDAAKRRKVGENNKPLPKPSPAQVMMNRYKMMQERVLQAEEEAKAKVKAKVKKISSQNMAKAATTTSKATVAGAGTAFNTYMKNKKTTAITAAKGQKRKAHTPTVAIKKLKRPVVEVTSSAKVGANIRQRYLNIFIDECLKLYPTDKEAFDRGKEEEENVYKRCTNKNIYLNICVNTVKRLRNEIEEKKKKASDPKPKGTAKKLSHAQMLDGAHAKNTNYTVNRSGGAIKLREEDFLGAELYKRLKPYILTEEQLKQNNFPRSDPVNGGCAVFFGENFNKNKGKTKGYEKLCVRCGKIFEVYPNGKYPVKQDCVYHWGKAWKKKIAGSLETRYTCCSGDLSSDGCQVAKAHCHETNKRENMSGFMKTIPCSPPIDGDYGVYALDCEMVYTSMGMELARVTVVGGDAEPVYESLVRPDNRIVDFNTRFSGITEDDMEDVNTSLRDVQAVLLSLFTDKTILMGHSLESDLIALKLIHSTVVDTSIVFPHRLGLPYKRALRNLMSEYLKKIIQDDVGGHDSLEDAVACIELMQYQLKEDARREARRVST